MTWVKCHDTLRKGTKRGLSRATRFIFLELCHEVRATRGTIALPKGKDLDVVHDLIGGNRKEVADALSVLTEPDPSNEEGLPMLLLHGPPEARKLTIPSWGRRGENGEPPGASTERARRMREQRSDNGHATGVAPPMQRAGNGDATLSREEKSREEDPDPPVVPQGDPTPAAPNPKPPKASRTKTERSRVPPREAPGSAVCEWLQRFDIPPLDDPEHGHQVQRFLNNHRARGTLGVDWHAAWANWRDGRFVGGAPAPRPPPPNAPPLPTGPRKLFPDPPTPLTANGAPKS